MDDSLEEQYPEAAPHIYRAVEEHSEEWVIENYFPEIANLGVIMDVPSVEELPFFDEEKHDAPTEDERRQRAEFYREYRENLKSGTRPDDG